MLIHSATLSRNRKLHFLLSGKVEIKEIETVIVNLIG